VARWRFGEDLVRDPSGVWRLAWTAEKNLHAQDLGDVPHELGAVLDEHLLGGRPGRVAAMRYAELCGRNWLLLRDRQPAAKYPSALVREVVGAPLHDLRTAIAEAMRRADPSAAARMIAGILGHRDLRTGEAYRALCLGDAAAHDWAAMRDAIATGKPRAA
jgi:integrase